MKFSHNKGLLLKGNDALKTGYLFYLLLWLLALALIVVRRLNHVGFPLNSFVNDWVTRFGDFYALFDEWHRLGLGGVGFGLTYFPSIYWIPELLFRIAPHPPKAVLIFLVLSTLIIVSSLGKLATHFKLPKIPVYVLILTSYPFVFSLTTANLELLTVGLIILSSFLFVKKRILFSSLLLGIAASMKIVPLIFVSMYLFDSASTWRKRLVPTLSAIFMAFFLNIISILLLPSGLLDRGFSTFTQFLKGWRESINLYTNLMLYSGAGDHFGHSLISFFRVIFGVVVEKGGTLLIIIPAGVFLANLAFIAFSAKRNPEPIGIALMTSISMSLVLPISTDYRLLYFTSFSVIFCLKEFYEPKFLHMQEYPNVMRLALIFFLTLMINAPKPWGHITESPYINASVWLTPIMLILVQLLVCIHLSASQKLGSK